MKRGIDEMKSGVFRTDLAEGLNLQMRRALRSEGFGASAPPGIVERERKSTGKSYRDFKTGGWLHKA